MRTLTDAQKIELTQDVEVRYLLESTPINYTSKFLNSEQINIELEKTHEGYHDVRLRS